MVSAAITRSAGTMIVSGLRGTQPWSVALTPSADSAATGVGALWARAKIALLMDGLRTGGDAAAIRADVVKVALDHHLVSAYTSLVAVDVTPTAPNGPSKIALVKASAPRGMEIAGQIPQTDTPATLQFLVALLALMLAGVAALAAQRRRA